MVLVDRQYRYTFVNHVAPGVDSASLIGRATPFDFVDAAHHEQMRLAFEAFRRSELRLRDAHRLETIGTLAGGMAHDINNLLSPILAHAELAQMSLPAGHEVQTHLRAVITASERASELVRRVLLFSRRQEPHKVALDLRTCLEEDLALLRSSVPVTVQLEVDLPAEPVVVLADRSQFGQAFANLMTNALQAIPPEGGTISVSLEASSESEPHAVVRVADTGAGMDASTLERIFDPFFTTKAVGAGTGLGLSIAQTVLREHGGDISVQSVRGRGSVFTLRLPVSSDSIVPRVHPAKESPPPKGERALSVLLVDDEAAVLSVAAEALTRAGHRVVTAPSATAALEICAHDAAAFDVLLTDHAMANVTGTALIAEVRNQFPRLACLLMTGRDEEETSRLARELGVEILAKPFSITTLVSTVERVGVTRTVPAPGGDGPSARHR